MSPNNFSTVSWTCRIHCELQHPRGDLGRRTRLGASQSRQILETCRQTGTERLSTLKHAPCEVYEASSKPRSGSCPQLADAGHPHNMSPCSRITAARALSPRPLFFRAGTQVHTSRSNPSRAVVALLWGAAALLLLIVLWAYPSTPAPITTVVSGASADRWLCINLLKRLISLHIFKCLTYREAYH